VTGQASILLDKLFRERVCIPTKSTSGILATPCIPDESEQPALNELLTSGFVKYETVGKREVLVLGSWIALENPFHAETRSLQSRITVLLQRYPPATQQVVRDAIEAFKSTRRSLQIADSIVIRFLEWCEKYSVGIVDEGLSTYLRGDYASRGMKEEYAQGIIRGKAREARTTGEQPVSRDTSSPWYGQVNESVDRMRVDSEKFRNEVDSRVNQRSQELARNLTLQELAEVEQQVRRKQRG